MSLQYNLTFDNVGIRKRGAHGLRLKSNAFVNGQKFFDQTGIHSEFFFDNKPFSLFFVLESI